MVRIRFPPAASHKRTRSNQPYVAGPKWHLARELEIVLAHPPLLVYARVWNEKDQAIFAARAGTYTIVGDKVHETPTISLDSASGSEQVPVYFVALRLAGIGLDAVRRLLPRLPARIVITGECLSSNMKGGLTCDVYYWPVRVR
jgi:hypothetical protein